MSLTGTGAGTFVVGAAAIVGIADRVGAKVGADVGAVIRVLVAVGILVLTVGTTTDVLVA